MKKILLPLIVLIACLLTGCVTDGILDGKEVTASYVDGKPVFGVKFGTGK